MLYENSLPGSGMSLFDLKLKRALVVAPHADDEVLGAGGFIARSVADGWEVHVLFATISGYPSMARQDVSSTDARVSEVESAMKTLGVSGYDVLFREDHHCRLDTVPQADLIGFVERSLCRGVSLVIVPSRAHSHQDHWVMADACAAALRPAPPMATCRLCLSCSVTAARWVIGVTGPASSGQRFLSISASS